MGGLWNINNFARGRKMNKKISKAKVNSISNIKKIAVIGAGVMGSGIAQVFAQEGFYVLLNDIKDDFLQKALKRIKFNLKAMKNEKVLTKEAVNSAIENLHLSTELSKVREVDFAIEAITEELNLKQKLFQNIEKFVSSGTILATNTSGISITAIASLTQFPERIIGMHWWNPPYIIPVIEIIRGEKTANKAVKLTRELVLKLKKKPVVVQKDIPGFLGNRMQYALMREAIHLLESGIASAEDIDTMVKAGIGFKYPVLGPLETIDMAGMDIFYKVSKYLYKNLDASSEPPSLIWEKVREKKLGMKSKEGFYNYQNIDLENLNRKRMKQFIALLKQFGYY